MNPTLGLQHESRLVQERREVHQGGAGGKHIRQT